MKLMTSEAAIKYREENIVNTENRTKELGSQLADKAEPTVDADLVLQYAKYLLEHLSEILLDLSNPLRRAAFFGSIFNEMPTYADLDFGTHKKSSLPGVNELFKLTAELKSTFGGPSWNL